MFVNDIEEYQAALSKINLRESTMPVYKGRIVESASTYNKARCIIDCPEMAKAQKFCYGIDWDNLCQEDCDKIDALYQLGVDRGFITEPVADDDCCDCAPSKCCGCGCDVASGADYCPDCMASLGMVEEKKECSDAECEKSAKAAEKAIDDKIVADLEAQKTVKEAEEGEDTGDAGEAEADAGAEADKTEEEKPEEEEKPADDAEKPEDADKGEAEEEKADQPEGDGVEKAEQDADEKKDEAEKTEGEDGEDAKGMSAEEKNNLKDQYTKLFKSVMLNNKFADAFCDLSIQDKAKVYAELAEKLGDSKPSDFLTKAEEKKLEGTVITA